MERVDIDDFITRNDLLGLANKLLEAAKAGKELLADTHYELVDYYLVDAAIIPEPTTFAQPADCKADPLLYQMARDRRIADVDNRCAVLMKQAEKAPSPELDAQIAALREEWLRLCSVNPDLLQPIKGAAKYLTVGYGSAKED